MPDQVAIEGVARKFESWAKSLSAEEQATLAEWLSRARREDVEAHWDGEWWRRPGAWSRAWSDTWATS